jgi:fibronectin-binding autotransporter adhesin
MSGNAIGVILYNGKRRLLSSACIPALALGLGFGSPAAAATYLVNSETDLRNAIALANADPDPSATITLTNNVSVSSAAFPAFTKPTTINTGSFTLQGLTLR